MNTTETPFVRLTDNNIEQLEPFFQLYAFGICDNTIGAVFQWRDIYESYFKIIGRCLCIRAGYGNYGDCYTVPIGCSDFACSFAAIEKDAEQNGIPLRFCVVPEEALPLLEKQYGDRMHVESIRVWADYLYDADAFRTYAGKSLHTQKNHVNRFYRDNPDAQCVLIQDSETEQKVYAFLDEYAEQHPESSELERNELNGARELLANRDRLSQVAAGLLCGGKIVALSIGEVKDQTLYVHVEKARTDISGAYPAMAQAFVRLFPEIDTVNREDDGGDAGLRYSKLQYKPKKLLEKYLVKID